MKRMEKEKKKKKSKIELLNKIYMIFLIIVLIIAILISFRTGMQMYYLVNTNLNNKDVPTKSDVADWNFEVVIEY